MLTRLNQQMGPDLAMLEVFITVVLLVIPAKGGTLRYANAGHCAPLLMRPTAPMQELGGGDMPLGVLLNAVVTDHEAELPPGSTLFVFTDGCFEWRRSNGSFLGSNHFGRTLQEHAAGNTPRPVRQVLDEITRQAGPAGLPDDCTLVAIQYQG
jgi:phosphoserine phosphatase RsbU/P